MSEKETTEPKVFIIESLDFDDEDNHRYEGLIISDILCLSNIECKYYYIRTKQELIEVINLFDKSNYRYLHISCHGGENQDSIWTTLDEISFKELGTILDPNLYHRRLFLSACSVVNMELAKEVIPKTECYSIIGPRHDIEFRDSAIMWASFYHLMFRENSDKMLREHLVQNLQKIVNAFGAPFDYYSHSRSEGIKKKLFDVRN